MGEGKNRVNIRRVAVLGAGQMGAQIAALAANAGIPCDLLDRVLEPGARNRLAQEGVERLLRARPAPLDGEGAAARITVGNFEDHMERLAQADWVVEAVAEDLEIKRQLWSKAAPHLRPEALLSTNTSGLSVAAVAAALPERLRTRFFGSHFFNPPRYLRLLELIPAPSTDPAAISGFREFAQTVLGKGVVLARDTPNFIANRIGTYGLAVTLRAMERLGLAPDEVDSITGPAMGRPKSATFRTLDLVGLDVFLAVVENVRRQTRHDWEREALAVPEWVQEMARRGWLGEKAGQGFYRKEGEQILALDPATMQYRPRRGLQSMAIQAGKAIEDPAARLRALVNAPDRAGQFAWAVLKETLLFVAAVLPEIADDIASVDRAMRWGFGWQLGPFEAWEAIGLRESAERVRQEGDGARVPGWVAEMVDSGESRFYREVDSDGAPGTSAPLGALYAAGPAELSAGSSEAAASSLDAAADPADATTGSAAATAAAPAATAGDGSLARAYRWMPVATDPRYLPLRRLLRSRTAVIRSSPGATLVDVGDEVAMLAFHSPKQAIGPDMVTMMRFAAEQVPGRFRGLVVGADPASTDHFCVGANLALVLAAAREGEWDELDLMIRQFQQANVALYRMPAPVVVGSHGMALGGGLEIALHADRVVAAFESYMGLVEVGAGVVPAGGGCARLLVRAAAQAGALRSVALAQASQGGRPGSRSGGPQGPAALLGQMDLQPLVGRFFEQVGTAKVSTSAREAREMGYLGPADVVVANLDHLLEEAKQQVLALDRQGYRAPEPVAVPVLGPAGRALMEVAALHLKWAGFATEYDVQVARKLARVLSGGDLPAGTFVTEEYLMDLEREAFLSLCGEPRTQARMQHLLQTGKPLRN